MAKKPATDGNLTKFQKFEAVRYKPRGWTWVDPTKEVEAFKEAVKCGFTTQSDVIAATNNGRDIEDVFEERAREIEMAKEKGLVFETSPEYYTSDAAKATAEAKAIKADAKTPDDEPKEPNDKPDSDRIFSLVRK